MKQRSTIFAICSAIALVGWIATGSYLFATNCCSDSPTIVNGIVQNNLFSIKDGNKFEVSSNRAIQFASNSTEPQLSEDIMDKLFETIQYIKSNPFKKLVLTGYYSEQETTNDQLGRNRALAIQNIFTGADVPPYQIEIVVKTKKNLQRSQGYLLGMIDFTFQPINPIIAEDDLNDFKVIFEDDFAFKKSSIQSLMETSAATKNKLSEIATYLKNRQSRRLIIEGYYHPSEINNSGLPNLGLVRANQVKILISSFGVPDQQIEIKGVVKPNLPIINSTLYGAFVYSTIQFRFQNMDKKYLDSLKVERIRIEKVLKEKKVYRFKDFGAEEMKIVKNDELRSYLQDIIAYTNINQRAAIYCVGHNNYTQDQEFNYNRGYERAEYVKAFLEDHGVHPDRIVVKSAGAKHPLGTNTTLYGQYINRRVDLIVSLDGTTPKLSFLPKIVPPAVKKTNKTPKLKDTTTDSTLTKKDSITSPAIENTKTSASDSITTKKEKEENISVKKDSL
jgi:OOP family OmpA-OmpF porin